jgi:hypothetical protein
VQGVGSQGRVAARAILAIGEKRPHSEARLWRPAIGAAPVFKRKLTECHQLQTRRARCWLARRQWPRGRYLQLGKSDLTARRGSGGLLSALRQSLSENLQIATICRQACRVLARKGTGAARAILAIGEKPPHIEARLWRPAIGAAPVFKRKLTEYDQLQAGARGVGSKEAVAAPPTLADRKSRLTARHCSGGRISISALRQFLSENLQSATNCRQGARGVGSQGGSGHAGDCWRFNGLRARRSACGPAKRRPSCRSERAARGS